MRAPIFIALVFALGACAGGNGEPRKLRHFKTNAAGPEEFAVLPIKPLQMPGNLNELPTPTPGSANITDPTPMADAVASLGGDGSRVAPRGGVPASDSALLSAAGRHGIASDIRPTLTAEDKAYRKRRGRFTGFQIVKKDEYNRAYKPQTLDANREQLRYRQAGVRTPASPPSRVWRRRSRR